MKRILLIVVCLIFSASAFGQAQITTKREKISDFTSKITKVVLTGNEFQDIALREAVKNSWTISPFEFCTVSEFNNLKTNENYYFLVLSPTINRGEERPGISVFTVVKGQEGAKTLNDMLEVATFPACAANNPTGKQLMGMPAILDIMQEFINRSMLSSFVGIRSVVRGLGKTKGYTILIDKSDIASSVSESFINSLDKTNIEIAKDSKIQKVWMKGAEKTAIAYSITPESPSKGSVCYTLVFDASTHELYYYRKHSYKKEERGGFLKCDLRKIRSRKR